MPKLRFMILLQIAPLGLGDDGDRRLLKHGDAADDRRGHRHNSGRAVQLIKCMKTARLR